MDHIQIRAVQSLMTDLNQIYADQIQKEIKVKDSESFVTSNKEASLPVWPATEFVQYHETEIREK